MAAIAQETDDAVDLAFEMAKRLREIDPENQLLKFFTEADDDAVWETFQKRFSKRGSTPEERASTRGQAYVWSRYYVALKKEVDLKTNPEKFAAEWMVMFRKEVAEFDKIRPQLLEKYPSKDTYVALLAGKEVANGKNGDLLARQMMEEFPDDFILITCVIKKEDEIKEYMEGFEDALTKPSQGVPF